MAIQFRSTPKRTPRDRTVDAITRDTVEDLIAARIDEPTFSGTKKHQSRKIANGTVNRYLAAQGHPSAIRLHLEKCADCRRGTIVVQSARACRARELPLA